MRVIGRVLVALVAIMVAVWVLSGLFHFVLWSLAVALKLAIVGGVAYGGYWGYRKISGGGRSRRTLDSSKSLDWQYLKGKVDRETYVRRKGR